MSNFSKEELYDLYSKYLPTFTELAKKANESGVYFELDLSPEGNISFNSREYFNEVKDNVTKECSRVHTIEQGVDFVSDGSRTYVINEIKNS